MSPAPNPTSMTVYCSANPLDFTKSLYIIKMEVVDSIAKKNAMDISQKQTSLNTYHVDSLKRLKPLGRLSD